MYQKTLIFLLLTTFFNEIVSEGPILRNCGDTIVSDEGVIEYKLNQTYLEKERCAFIIRSWNFSNFIFTLEEHGIADDTWISAGAINIFTFDYEGHMDSIHLGPPNPVTQVFVKGLLAVVVFRTEYVKGSGFRLRFQGVGDPSHSVYKWGAEIATGEYPGELTYPRDSDLQTVNTLSLFVISANHTALTSVLEKVRLEISPETHIKVCGGGNACDCDALDVFSFNSERLAHLGRFCDVYSHPRLFETAEIFILFFRALQEYPRTLNFGWDVVRITP